MRFFFNSSSPVHAGGGRAGRGGGSGGRVGRAGRGRIRCGGVAGGEHRLGERRFYVFKKYLGFWIWIFIEISVLEFSSYFPHPRLNLSDLSGFMVDWRGTEMVYIWLLVVRHAAQPTAQSIPKFVF